MLLDRETDLARARDALRAAAERIGSLVVVESPLGMGRTALAHAIATMAEEAGALVLRAAASTLDRQFPFGVVRQLCEPVMAELTDDERDKVVDGVAAVVRPMFAARSCTGDVATEAGVQPAQQELLHGVRHLLAVASERRPVVLVVDDLPLADEESLRCLGYLVNRLTGIGVVLVVTVRGGEQASEAPPVRYITNHAAHVLHPGRLSRADTGTLVRLHFGRPGAEPFIHACHAGSHGNPLLLRSILAELALTGRGPGADLADAVAGCRPAALRDRFVSRLRGQPAATRGFLQAMGLLGAAGDLDLVADLAGLDNIECLEILRSLTRQGLVLPGRPPTFVHPVVGAAVDELVAAEDGDRLHLAAAAVLRRAGKQAEEIAEHLLAVPSPQPEWATDVLTAAAESAAARGAPDLASRYLRRALLDTPSGGPARAVLLVALATVGRAVDPAASVGHVLEAVSLLRSPRERAAAVVRLSPMSLGTAPVGVGAVVREVAARLGDPDRLTGADRELALRVEARVRHLADADALSLGDAVHRLRTLDGDRHLGSPAGRELLAVLLHTAALTGQVPAHDVIAPAEMLLALTVPGPDAVHSCLPLAVTALTVADRPVAAQAWLDTAREQVRAARDPVAAAVVELHQALVLAGRGHLGAAKAAAVAGLGGAVADPVTASGALLAAMTLDVHDAEFAGRVLRGCGDRTDHPVLIALAQFARGVLAARDGDLATALTRLLDCGRQVERAGWRNPAVFPWRSMVAVLRHRLGDTAAAREYVAAEHELALAWGAPAAVGRTLRLRGAFTPGEAGIRLLRAAVDVLSGSQNELERARAHVLLGGRLLARGDGDAAEHLGHGRSLALACGAGWLAERANGGQRLPAAATAPALTPAERRVVELVAAGHTNRAVADELGVSSRAVEKHLTNSYRKLNVAGRAELRATLGAARATVAAG
ncbi:ATP-binding protein [Actinokineospora sp.]|uniref:ATP-binding protein n=1 Tax=Actinokineospora sp. TaxID=1872133 RepID=UPI004037B5F3